MLWDPCFGQLKDAKPLLGHLFSERDMAYLA
jgi:hypothetical protein